MKTFEKILIATDGSEKNIPAVKKGLELGRETGSMVYAMYVIEGSPYVSPYMDVFPDPVTEALREEGEKAMEHVRNMADGMNVGTHILTGKPAHVICDFAKKTDIDLIVAGYQGKTGFHRLLLGSVAERILRLAECSVLIVKSE